MAKRQPAHRKMRKSEKINRIKLVVRDIAYEEVMMSTTSDLTPSRNTL